MHSLSPLMLACKHRPRLSPQEVRIRRGPRNKSVWKGLGRKSGAKSCQGLWGYAWRAPSRLSTESRSARRSSAASLTWCSHNRTTVHPRLRSSRVCRRSRSTFAAIFSFHQAALLRGVEKWRLQPCQKQPSTKTQILAFRRTTSALHRREASGRVSLLKRSPTRLKTRRSSRSAAVSFPTLACITLRTSGVDARGARARMERRFTGRSGRRRLRGARPR